MEQSPKLKVLVNSMIGYERIDVEAATELGIMVCNSPTPENFVSVAESSIAMMTMLAKRLKRKEARVRNGEWSQGSDRGFLLWQKTIGLVGLGRTGTEVAKRLAGWDVRLICSDPYASADKAKEMGVELVDLPTLLKESDFVSLHVVITPETFNMIGEEQLRMMKPTAYLVNTSRGEAIEEKAMQRAIEENWIAGAALDVFHEEPLPVDSPMRNLDPERVFLTPHNIAHTDASLVANRAMAVETLVTALSGEVPGPVVNPDVITKWQSR
jgi:D-3-phosphoglycerate dehydrogenase